ncbi:MAG: N-6 DNA methylase [Candidatus Eisenbacteria sp.]|nr:N-6 DNA methylase [Candidatus Eisenbacteria bacterium]
MNRRQGTGQAEQGRHATIRRWTRILLRAGAAAGYRSPSDLGLSVIGSLAAAHLGIRGHTLACVNGLRDLVPASRALEPDLACHIGEACREGPVSPLDSCVRRIWAESHHPDLLPFRGDALGIAYEEILSIEDSASGETSRKLGGVFYTPPKIVDYILARTLGRSRGAARTGKITILDPACGSGVFLVEAYHRLKDSRRGDLNASLFGVDVDARAASLARTRLGLTALARAGSDAGGNPGVVLRQQIVVGSALAESVDGREIPSAIDTAFGEIRDRGGFDLVIGNPPYVKNRDLDGRRKELWRRAYYCARGQYDLMVLFLEKGIEVLKPGGRLGFLVSNKFMTSSYGKELRRRILETCRIEEIVDLSRARVFRGAAIYPAILILKKCRPGARAGGNVILRHAVTDLREERESVSIPQSELSRGPERTFTTALTGSGLRLIGKIEKMSTPLGELATIACGLADPGMGRSVVSRQQAVRDGENRRMFPFIRVENIAPYQIRWTHRWISLDPGRYLPARLTDFGSKKIVIPGIRPTLQAAYDTRGYALGRVYYIARHGMDHLLLLGLLNSSVLNWYYRTVFGAVRMAGGFLRFNGPYLRALPIPVHDCGDPAVKGIGSLVRRRLQSGRSRRESQTAQARRGAIEADIDSLVGDLFGLSRSERETVHHCA